MSRVSVGGRRVGELNGGRMDIGKYFEEGLGTEGLEGG